MNTTKNKNLTSFDELLDKEYGKKGTEKREDFEKKYAPDLPKNQKGTKKK